MMWCRFPPLLVLCVVLCATAAVPDEKHGKDRVVTERPLSDKHHFEGGGLHDADYDHEAFLGDQAEEFMELSPEESKERLGEIFDKIDTDGDGLVSEEELNAWIHSVQHRYITSDVETQWTNYASPGKDTITWEDYNKNAYSFLDVDDGMNNEISDDDKSQYEQMRERDRRRFAKADLNGNGELDKEEFKDFLHPETSDRMKDIVVEETMEDIDTDKDGKISIDEYISDMYHSDGSDEEPAWVEKEREQFNQMRDTNQDGFLDMAEVKQWILPENYDHSLAEAQHLIRESDTTGDGLLTKEEVLENYDAFVASQATDFGEVLNRHDEF